MAWACSLNDAVTQKRKTFPDKPFFVTDENGRPVTKPESDAIRVSDELFIDGVSVTIDDVRTVEVERVSGSNITIEMDHSKPFTEFEFGIPVADIERVNVIRSTEGAASGRVTFRGSYFGKRTRLPSFPVSVA